LAGGLQPRLDPSSEADNQSFTAYRFRMTSDQQHDVQMLAFFIWERNGRPGDRALDHWLEAEYLVLTGSFVQNPGSSPDQKPGN
jgi:hypothetical protein